VNTVKHFVETQSATTYPEVKNEAGEIVTPARVVVTCPPLPGNMIPAAPRNKADGTKSKFRWPAFSGLDCGPQDGKALHNTSVLTDAANEVGDDSETDSQE